MKKKKRRARKKKDGLDKTDCKLIEILQKDGRLSNIQIAKQMNISEATIRTRLKRLLDEGFIKIVAVGNPFMLGFQIAGKIDMRIDIQHADEIMEKLKEIKKLHYVAQTTGATDITADFNVKSREELHHLLFEELGKIDGIRSTETSLMIQYVKDQYDWGTAYDSE